MSRRFRFLSAVFAVVALAGCGASSTTPNSLPSATLSIAVSPESVVANGTSTVSVTVSGAATGSISVSANRGLFSNGLKVIQVTSTPATLTLTACSESLDATCPGAVVIRAVDAAGVAGQASATFTSSGIGPSCLTCGPAACVGVICDTMGHTCSTDSPSTCTTCPGGTTEICNDGKDNNCNGLVDCADPQCQPVGNQSGAACDALGHTCSVNGAPGPSACTVCSGNGGTPEAKETSCGDGKDNDCNGFVDCQDANCSGQPCAVGFTCDPTAKTCTVPSTTCTTCGAPACIGLTCDSVGHTCSSASPSTCSTCPGGSVEICTDGKDNNCNGLVDCADPQCQPVGNTPGSVCSAFGLTCSARGASGTSTCSVCSGNGGTSETREASCGDGKDNDCNGLVDCQDPNCGGLTCSPAGLTCDLAAKTCTVCPGGQPVEVTCNDGIDNDCNGLIDCVDSACQPSPSGPGKSCGPYGKLCASTGGGSCVCSGNGGAAEATETSCGDLFDNDCNAKVDCEDTACNGQSCDRNGSVGMICSRGLCSCPGGSIEVCNDGIDNNCNGLIDCQDSPCQASGSTPGAKCDAIGNACSSPAPGIPSTCSVCSGNGKPAERPEVSCSDSIDNDCNALVDCLDPNCRNQACNGADPAYRCTEIGGIVQCANPSSQYSLIVSAGSSRIPADGSSKTQITATLKQNGSPLAGQRVTFTTSLAGTSLSTPVVTNANGQTTVDFTANSLGGTAVVSAAFDAPGGMGSVVGSTDVVLPKLGQVNLVSQQYDILGADSSGFQETSVITFELLDTLSQPYPPGLRVDFSHRSLGLSYIGQSYDANCDLTASPIYCSDFGYTDEQGRVAIQLTSGRTAGVVSVAAGAAAGGLSASGLAGNIAIVGAKASGAHITMDCTSKVFGKRIPALVSSDCNYSHLVHPIDCTVALADRFNNVLGVTTLAQFFSEGGTAGPAAYTPQYDPKSPPTQQVDLGIGVSYVRADGKVPIDTTPFGREFALAYPDGCNNGQHNPRDGLVTIIAMAYGEEGFVDLNGSGAYNDGEPFIDMGEPYIDANDTGKYEDGEYFFDYDGNGTYDGPDGVWNPNTVIWAETRVLFVGNSFYYFDTVAGRTAGSQFYNSGSPPEPTPAIQFDVNGATPGPASSQSYSVVLSDGNFNPLPPTATFSVKTLFQNASATVALAPSYPGALGISFSQQYCTVDNLSKVTNPALCSNVCPAKPGRALSTDPSPCYVVTNVGACNFGLPDRTDCTGFAYGLTGTVSVAGSKVGPDTVLGTVVWEGATGTISVDGVVR